MKSLKFKELRLLSRLENKARRVAFHPRLTVIAGKNDTGKSSLIKSIYWSFGAEPAVMHPRWKSANVVSAMTFLVDDDEYTIVRFRRSFAVLSAAGELLLRANSVTKELAPFLAELLDFGLVLTSRDNVAIIPPPAYAFLPFYVDQDAGWQNAFASFGSLSQIPNFRTDVTHYHTGIRPNEFYRLKVRQSELELQVEDAQAERKALQSAVDKVNDTADSLGLETQTGQFEEAIGLLLTELAALRNKRREAASDLDVLIAKRTVLDHEIAIGKRALEELDKDYKWVGKVDDDQIMCPTCGTVHENSFLSRFAIVDDREACRDFILKATLDYERIGRDLTKARKVVADVERDLEKVAEALTVRRGDVQLGEVLQAEGRRVAGEILVQRVRDFNQSIADLNTSLMSISKQLKEISDKSKRQEIERYYFARMSANLTRLNVKTVPLSTVEKIDCRVRDTGSDQPRALLAYDFAVIDTIQRYSTSFIAPLVIDSPLQQDQDDQNARLMLEFIAEKASSNGQIVLGTVSLHGVDIGDGSIIELTDELSLLRAAEFEEINREFNVFFDAVT
jgi:hypothetical protein